VKDTVIIEGKEYISSSRAAEMARYTNDYIGQLCRRGKLVSHMVGRIRLVEKTSLEAYMAQIEQEKILKNSAASDVAKVVHAKSKEVDSVVRKSMPARIEALPERAVVPAYVPYPHGAWTITYENEDKPFLPPLRKKLPVQVQSIPVAAVKKEVGPRAPVAIVTARDAVVAKRRQMELVFSRIARGTAALGLALAIGGSSLLSAYSIMRPAEVVKTVAADFTASKNLFSGAVRQFAWVLTDTVEFTLNEADSQSAAVTESVALSLGSTSEWFGKTTDAVVAFVKNIFGSHEKENITETKVAAPEPKGGDTYITYNNSTTTAPGAARTVYVHQTIEQPSSLGNRVTALEAYLANYSALQTQKEWAVYESIARASKHSASSSGGLGSVTSVQVSGGSTGLSFSGGPVTSSGTVVLGGTLGVTAGGTGIVSYQAGDILYASAADTLSRLAVGSSGQVLKVSGGVPVWGADVSGGGAGLFSTTTDNLALYPSTASQVLVVGGSSTTTTGNVLEVIGDSKLGGNAVVSGNIVTSYIAATSTTATSSFANGINLTGGCYSINGTCLGAGSGSGTVSVGNQNQFAYYSATGNTISGTSALTFDGTGLGITVPAELSIDEPLVSALDIYNNSGYGLTVSGIGEVIRATGLNSTVNAVVATAGTFSAYLAMADSNIAGYFNNSANGTSVSLANATEAMRVTGGNAIFLNGNVGIGTTSPYAKLSVGGPVVAESFNATSSTATSTFAGGLTVSGLVGIGTTAGLDKLSVFGNIGMPKGSAFVFRQGSGLGSVVVSYGSDSFNNGVLTSSSIFQSSNAWLFASSTNATSILASGVFEIFGTRAGLRVEDEGTSTPLFMIDAGGRMAQGTSSPYAQYSLVIPTAARTGIAVQDASAQTAPVFDYRRSDGIPMVAIRRSNGSVSGTTGAGQISLFNTTGTETKLYGNSALYIDVPGNNAVFRLLPSGDDIYFQNVYNKGNINFTGNSNTTLSGGVFFNATGTVAFGPTATARMTILGDSAGGNVGIGTTGPGAKLDVQGGSAGTPALSLGQEGQTTTYTNRVLIEFNKYTNKRANFSLVNSGGLEDFAINVVNDAGVGSNAMTFQRSNGNVGIGTTTPNSKLTIFNASPSGRSSATPGSALAITTDNLAGAAAISIEDTSGQNNAGSAIAWLGSGANAAIQGSVKVMSVNYPNYRDSGMIFSVGAAGSTNPNEVMRLLQNGNVGIGTTSPWAQLSVNPNGISGPAFAIGSSTATNFVVTSGGNVGIGVNVPTAPLTIREDGNGTGLSILSNTGVGQFSVQNGALNAMNSTGATTIQLNGSAAGGALLSSGQVFSWDANATLSGSADVGFSRGGAGKINVGNGTVGNSSGTLIAGTIGIGTTSPYAKLSVVGQVVGEYFTATSTTATSSIAGGLNVGNGGLVYDFTTGVTSIAALETGSMNFDVDAGQVSWVDLPISAAPANTVESYSAQIAGTPIFTVYGQSNGSGGVQNLRVAVGTTSPASRFTVWGEGTGVGRMFELVNNASTTVASVLDNGTAYFLGNVGIGTTSPYAKLAVAGQVLADSFYATSTTATSTISGVFSVGTTTPTPEGIFVIGTTSPNLLVNRNSGNIGIGSSSPWRSLSVTGTVAFDGLTASIGAGSVCLSSTKQLVYNSASDACLSSLRDTKHDIVDLGVDALAQVRNLNPVSFVYNDSDGRVRYGFIAEEAAEVDPHLATYNAASALTGIDDRAILAVTIRAVKELDRRVGENGGGGVSTSTLFAFIASTTDQMFAAAAEARTTPLMSKMLTSVSEFVLSIKEWTVEKITAADAYFGRIFADRVETKELCVEDVCITKDQFRAMVLQAQAASTTEEVLDDSEESDDDPIDDVIEEGVPPDTTGTSTSGTATTTEGESESTTEEPAEAENPVSESDPSSETPEVSEPEAAPEPVAEQDEPVHESNAEEVAPTPVETPAE
jgi:hypothetical protein